MHVIFTRHALQQAVLRGISRDDIIEALAKPDSTVPGEAGKLVAQKAFGGKLLRVVYMAEPNGDAIVVTEYKTSKINKYQP